MQPVSGGCINNASKIITNYGNFFLKWNINAPEKMFDTEVKGLELLQNSKTIYIPQMIAYDNHFLMMEFIEKVSPTHSLWEEFGRDLSELHKVSDINFGLDHNNFIGSLLQKNNQQPNWIDFFINQRIIPQLSIGNFSSELTRSFDKLFLKIEDLFPNESSSLLHGDLFEWAHQNVGEKEDPSYRATIFLVMNCPNRQLQTNEGHPETQHSLHSPPEVESSRYLSGVWHPHQDHR